MELQKSTLVDYFLVIGPPKPSIENHTKFQENLTPATLSQFPPFEKKSLSLPGSLASFCFPFGCDSVSATQGAVSSLYTCVFTDELGSRVYCTCLKVFELHGTQKLVVSTQHNSEEVHTLPINMLDEFSTESFFGCKKTLSLNSKPSFVAETRRINFFASEGVLVPKCLVLVSKFCFFETFKDILYTLFKLSTRELDFPLELYIAHLVFQVPAPVRGHKEVLYLLDSNIFRFSLAPCNRIPTPEVNFEVLFKALSLSNILYTFRNILLEKSVVFVSESEDKLSTCSFGLQSLLYPFHWELVYVPLLPEEFLEYLESPVNFIFGVHKKLKPKLLKKYKDSVCLVDLDEDTVNGTKHSMLSALKGHSNTLPALPFHYSKKLFTRVSKTLSKYNLGDFSSRRIRESFFQFFVSTMKHYKKALNFQWREESNSEIFNSKSFIRHSKRDAKNFLKAFVNTQMFNYFCLTRVRPKSILELSECLMFDEHIQAKFNRSFFSVKASTPFINDHSLEVSKQHQILPVEKLYRATRTYKYKTFPQLNPGRLKKFGVFID